MQKKTKTTASAQATTPKKRLGQHFLIAQNIAHDIAAAIPAKPNEQIIEIGPGKGALSVHIEKRFPSFHCIEIDDDVIPELRAKLTGHAWTLHRADARTFDISTVGTKVHIVGNLPYNAAAFILKNICLQARNVLSVTCMVQREVAERIVSAPHSKENGFLSIFCQFFGSPRILFHVPPASFFPPPKIESSVFTMNIFAHQSFPIPEHLWEDFFELVDCGFRMRRKTLLNNLSATYPNLSKTVLADVIAKAGIIPTARPEDLGVTTWCTLYKTLSEQA